MSISLSPAEQDADNSTEAPSRHLHSVSIDRTFQLPTFSTSIESYDEIQPESLATTPLESGNLNLSAPRGNVLQRRKSRSINSLDLERGPGAVRISTLSQDTGNDLDNSSQKSFYENAATVASPSHYIEGSAASHQSSLSERDADTRGSEEGAPELFRAFPESKWFRSVVFAVIGFCVMTLMVLGNLIYTYCSLPPPSDLRIVQTAQGHSQY